MPDRSMQSGPTAGAASPSGGGRAPAEPWPLLETLHSTLLSVGAALMGFAPRLLPGYLAMLAIITVVEVWRTGRPLRAVLADVFAPLPMRFALALLAFAAVSSLWASERGFALMSVVQVGLLVLSMGAIMALLPGHIASLSPRRRNRFIRAVPLGFVTGLLFLIIEFASGNAISLAFLRWFPSVAGESAKEVIREGDRVVGFLSFYLDRNVAAQTLLLPGAAAATLMWLPRGTARWAAVAMIGAMVGVAAVSSSGAASLALVCGLIAALAVARWPISTQRLMMAGSAFGILLALPLGHLPSLLGFETARWLPPSARERALIWDHTATAARRSPLVGIGVQSTRFQEPERKVHVDGVNGERRPLGWHAHNIVLQTWLELGMVGALLLLGLVMSVLRAIAAMPRERRPAALALFTMIAAIGLTGWGMWQPWLIAIVGIALAGLSVSERSTG